MRMKKGLIITAVLILVYAIFGFFIAPPVLESNLISGITEHLGRKAKVDAIKINPFSLSVTIKGFELSEPDGEHFFGFAEFYVNFQLSSAFRRAYTFHEVRLIAPDCCIKILPDDRMNFSDLLPSQDQAEQDAGQGGQMPAVIIGHLNIDQGRLAFSDLARTTPFETTFSPIRLTLNKFSTRKGSENPYSFTASTGKGEMLSWEGRFSVNPIRSKGRFDITGIKKRKLWEYVQDKVRFEVKSGSIDLAAKYTMEISGEDVHVELTDGEMKFNEFNLSEKGKDKTLISIPSFSVEGVKFDLAGRNIQVDSVKSNDARFEGWIDPEGNFSFQTLFSMDGIEDKGEASIGAPDQKGAASRPWKISIGELKLEDYSIALENRTLAKPLRVELAPVHLSLRNLSNQKNTQAEAGIRFNISQSGSVQLKGVVGFDPVVADMTVKVEALDLKPLQSYLDSVAQIDLARGTASLKGKMKYGFFGDSGPEMRFEGMVGVEDFEVVDQLNAEDLVKWDAIHVNGIAFDVAPNKLSISEIVVRRPYARIAVRPDKTVNVNAAFSPRKGGEDRADDAVFVVERPVEAIKSKGQGPMPISIDTVRIENGSANFEDMSLKPNVVIGIQGLSGTVEGLTTESSGRADVLLEGKVNKYAPLKIYGQINPLSHEAFTDLVLSFKNIGLTTFSPYSGKFVGNTIEKGKLSLDLKYRLSEKVLKGENKIVLDQLTFGEPTDSPDATKLPVGMAVALLRDRKGVIDMELPVQGNLDDPEFTYGSAVLKALMNLITKTAASPFSALGKLVGGSGEELSHVDFEFGRAVILNDQAEKLKKLALALKERPKLRLEIKGAADRLRDGVVMAGKALPAQLEGAENVDENSSIETIPVDETALRKLAQDRAMKIKEYLTQEGGISDEQVFMTDLEIKESLEGTRVSTSLTLSGM